MLSSICDVFEINVPSGCSSMNIICQYWLLDLLGEGVNFLLGRGGGGTDDVVSFEVRSQEHSCSTKPHNELSKTQQLVVRLRL